MGAEGPELEEPWALEGSIHDRETEARVGRDVPRPRPARRRSGQSQDQSWPHWVPQCPLQTVPALGSAGPRPPAGPCAGHPLKTVPCIFSHLQTQCPAHCYKSKTKTQTPKSPQVTQWCLKTEWRCCVRPQCSPGPQEAPQVSMAPLPPAATGVGGYNRTTTLQGWMDRGSRSGLGGPQGFLGPDAQTAPS